MFLHLSVSHSVHRGTRHPLDQETDISLVEISTEVGGTHPTGMHSCSVLPGSHDASSLVNSAVNVTVVVFTTY